MPKGVCNRCGEYKWINKHHIFPKKFFGTKDNNETIQLCLDCHTDIHTFIPKEKKEKSFYSNLIIRFLSGITILIIIFGISKILNLW